MKRLLKRIALVFSILLFLLAAIAVYSYHIEPNRLIVHEKNLKVRNWSANLDNFKIVAVSDIHGGSHFITEEKIRQIVELANAQNPDLIVLLGDFVSQTEGRNSSLKMPSEIVAENLKGLRARYGVFAVIGNHDWWYNEQKFRAELESAEIKVLENEVAPLQANGETIYLWGIEDFWKRRQVPREPFNEIPAKKNIIVITHNPDSLLKSPNEISLMLSGHSHGGQVWFPFYGGYPFVNDKRFMAGEAEFEGRKVFVTTGIGTSGPPIRFGVAPEVAVLNLTAEN